MSERSIEEIARSRVRVYGRRVNYRHRRAWMEREFVVEEGYPIDGELEGWKVCSVCALREDADKAAAKARKRVEAELELLREMRLEQSVGLPQEVENESES